MNEITNDVSSNPLNNDHLPVAGEITEEDDQIPFDPADPNSDD